MKRFPPAFLGFLVCICIVVGAFHTFSANANQPLVNQKGDTDGDNRVNEKDATYLLYHVVFGNKLFPLAEDEEPSDSNLYQKGDMDGDDQVNSNDAIYLLYHTLMGPQHYPLAGEEGWIGPDQSESLPNKLRVQQVTALPVANEQMSYDERRQLALDYFELQLSFQWTPDMDITDYPSTYYTSDEPKTLDVGTVYGGIPYQSTGTGNLYRWLEYYDETTGVFSFSKAFAENGGYGNGAKITDVKYDAAGNITYKKYRSFMVLFNQCSVASFWGWGRVVNSANFIWTADMNVYNGFIPVGLFDYGYTHNGKYYGSDVIRRWGETDSTWNPKGYDIDDAISDWNTKNGKDAIYKCYSKLKKADCLVNPGHAMMVKQLRLKQNPDGSINFPQSCVVTVEQVEGWAETGTLPDGTPFKNQGAVDREYTFETLQNKGYLPFTFAEFLDPDDAQDKLHLDHYLTRAEKLSPIAKRHSLFALTNDRLLTTTGVGLEQAQIATNLNLSQSSLSYSQFSKLAIASNYPISDLFVVIRSANGAELLKNIFRAPNPQYREVNMSARKSTWETNSITVSNGVSALANGQNTIEISLQLSNGEKHLVYSGKLTA